MVLDEAWNFSRVRSPFWRIYFNLEPGASVSAQGRRWTLGPDRLLILPADVTFDCVGQPGVRHLWVHFDLPGSADFSTRLSPVTVKLPSAEVEIWSRLHAQVRAERGAGLSRLRHACAGAVWLALSQIDILDRAPCSPRLRRLLSWLDARLGRPPTLGAMAAATSLGSRAFSRWFVRETGRTPVDFLTDRRIREACRRLRFTDDSIEQIASITGFANRHHFSRVFRQRTQHAPAEYRRGGA
jgi:AraC family transcriptional regulator, arabinose operon regulatory protein